MRAAVGEMAGQDCSFPGLRTPGPVGYYGAVNIDGTAVTPEPASWIFGYGTGGPVLLGR